MGIFMKLLFVGDIALGDHPKTVGFGFFSRYKLGIPTDKVIEIFPNNVEADIKFGNLEFALDEDGYYKVANKIRCCKGSANFVSFLKAAGFNVLNVANNHINQYGVDSFDKTVKLLHDYGILACGMPRDFEGDSVVKIRDKSVCFLGWSDRPRQYFNAIPPYNELNVPECYSCVKKAAKKFDIVCVSLHWGEEFVEVPSNREREIARKLVDHGANIIIGHHPHVIREVEEYNGGLIAYSLGNFIGDMLWDRKTRQSVCLSVNIEKNIIKDWELIPAIIAEDYFPKYLRGESANIFNNELKVIQNRLNKILMDDSSYKIETKKSLRRHQFLTIIHFLKNLSSYQSGFAIQTIISAFKDRLVARQ